MAATADITGLTATSTTYDFRVVAINSLTGADGVAFGDAAQFTTTPPVSIDAEAVNNVTSTGATLTAQVNPNGLDTHVQFQFVTRHSSSRGSRLHRRDDWSRRPPIDIWQRAE